MNNLHLSYEEQLAAKKHQVKELMEKHCKVRPIIGMDENPWHYRHKVQAVFGLDRKKQQISGVYEEKTHRILPVETCLIEDQKADAIIATVRSLLKSFKIKVYDEDTGYGLLRYVLIRKAEFTDEIMVVLVTASPVFPSKRNFVEALRREHPEITTVVQNVNDRTDSLVLGSKYQVLWGKGYIVDRLCGYLLLVIDDFGMERGTEYALERIYNIIDGRYRSRKPLIVTTNLTLTELKKPQDTAHARIYDRLLELCTPIACTGPSMRKNIGQAKLNLLKTLLA